MSNPIKILLVEDNADDEHLALRALRKWDQQIEIEVVRDGQEALERILNADLSLPNVVLLDINLPKISGISVLTQVREAPRTAKLPVIVLVSSDEPAQMKAEYEFCASGTIQKPLLLESFWLPSALLG